MITRLSVKVEKVTNGKSIGPEITPRLYTLYHKTRPVGEIKHQGLNIGQVLGLAHLCCRPLMLYDQTPAIAAPQ